MKHLIPTVLSAALALASCSQESSEAPVHASEGTSGAPTSYDKLKGDAQSAYESAKTALAEKQKEFRAHSQEHLDALDAKLAELRGKAEQASADAKPKLEELSRDLAKQRDQVAAKVDQWKTTSADAWQSFTTQVDQTLHDLDRKVDEALENR